MRTTDPTKNTLAAAPFLKWAGGKRQLLPELHRLLPEKICSYTYCEPFVGAGALLFSLQPKTAYINDSNHELMNVYRIIKDHPEELIATLAKHPNDRDYFYTLREIDRDNETYAKMSNIEKAARIIYLNKTCYNGLFRVNSAGEFNAPFGDYANPNIINEPALRAVSNYLNTNQVIISSGDYTSILKEIPYRKHLFFYLDPPYDPVSDTASFTSYTKHRFSRGQQIKLREFCDELNSRKIKFILSNSDTEFINNQYCKYNIFSVQARRNINSIAERRSDTSEVLVTNYE